MHLSSAALTAPTSPGIQPMSIQFGQCHSIDSDESRRNKLKLLDTECVQVYAPAKNRRKAHELIECITGRGRVSDVV